MEQVFADPIDGPWAHLPSTAFHANAAWVHLAVTAHALTRAACAGLDPPRRGPRGATIRAELIQVAARPARSGRNTIT